MRQEKGAGGHKSLQGTQGITRNNEGIELKGENDNIAGRQSMGFGERGSVGGGDQLTRFLSDNPTDDDDTSSQKLSLDWETTSNSLLDVSYGTMRYQYTSYVMSKFESNKQVVSELKKSAEQQVAVLLVTLLTILSFSLYYLRDSFQCEGGSDRDCEDIRKNLSCKSTVVSPMRSQMQLTIGQGRFEKDYIKVKVFCSWETAQSQIRIYVVVTALYMTFLAFRALRNDSLVLADRFLNSQKFFVFLLLTCGIFDLLAVNDSINDNYGLCQDPSLKDYKIHSTLQSFDINCSTGTFQFLGYLLLTSSLGLYSFSQTMKNYRKSVSNDGRDEYY